MGTNFYLKTKNAAPWDEGLHIGKGSAGWCFGLHVYPGEDVKPQTLDDWRKLFGNPEYTIVSQNGMTLTAGDMLDRILKRSHPRGLKRHPLDDQYCIRHGVGTYDLLVGEFS